MTWSCQYPEQSNLRIDWATERNWAPFVDNAEFAPRNGDGPNLVLSSWNHHVIIVISSVFHWQMHFCATCVLVLFLQVWKQDSKRHLSSIFCMRSIYISVILSVSPRAKTSFSEACISVTACSCMTLRVTVIRNQLVRKIPEITVKDFHWWNRHRFPLHQAWSNGLLRSSVDDVCANVSQTGLKCSSALYCSVKCHERLGSTETQCNDRITQTGC